MNGESILGESGQFAPRKIVGRPATPRQVLWQLEQIRLFTDKYAKRILKEGDFYPVQKTVEKGPS